MLYNTYIHLSLSLSLYIYIYIHTHTHITYIIHRSPRGRGQRRCQWLDETIRLSDGIEPFIYSSNTNTATQLTPREPLHNTTTTTTNNNNNNDNNSNYEYYYYYIQYSFTKSKEVWAMAPVPSCCLSLMSWQVLA